MKGRKLPDTTLSRSIIIEMRRKKAGEKVTHFRSIDDAGLAELRQRALRWANDNGAALKDAEPDMPPGFDNRLGDNWQLLLAIADFAGGEWPTRARKAAIKLSKVADAASTGARLLADIKAIFYPQPDRKMPSRPEPLERISSAKARSRACRQRGKSLGRMEGRQADDAELNLRACSSRSALRRKRSGFEAAEHFRATCESSSKMPGKDTFSRNSHFQSGTVEQMRWMLNKSMVFKVEQRAQCSTLKKCKKSNNHGLCSAVPL